MAITVLTATTQAVAINYNYTTSGSTDWTSVPSSTYFYDFVDKLPHYKNSSGTVLEIFSSSGGGGTFTGGTVSGGTTFIGGLSASSSTTDALIVTGSGSTSPLFSVRGSNGTLFSVTDNLIGSLFTVTNSSSQPILQVNDNNTILMGNYLAPSLNLTVTKSVSSGLTDIYAIPTSAYTAAFFDYSVNDGSNLRSGTVRSIWDGSTISWNDDTFSGIGSSSSLITFNMIITGGTAVLQSSGATSGWVVKTIIRSI
jgi:hypothetical protein